MKSQNIIILGATSGIGKMLTEIYATRDAKIGIAARREPLLKDIALMHSNIYYESCDIQEKDTCLIALERLVEKIGGHVDLFIICSGIGQVNATLDSDIEQETILTNVVGWTAVADWIFNRFLKQGYGHLAAISSIASLRGLGPAPSYSATKAFQAHYLESLYQRGLASGKPIYVTNIRPGFVNTPLLAHPEKFFWVVPVDKAAQQIVKALDRKKSVVTVTRRWTLLVPILLSIPNKLIAYVIKKGFKY